MALYWQQALPTNEQQSHEQQPPPHGQPTNEWDNVNLGVSQSQQQAYQWNQPQYQPQNSAPLDIYSASVFGGYQQQPNYASSVQNQTAAYHSYQTYPKQEVSNQQPAYSEWGVNGQWEQQQQAVQPQAQAQTQTQKQQLQAQANPAAAQLTSAATVTVEHKPILSSKKAKAAKKNSKEIVDYSTNGQRRNSNNAAEIKNETNGFDMQQLDRAAAGALPTELIGNGWEEGEARAEHEMPAVAQVAPIKVKADKELKRESADGSPFVAVIGPVSHPQQQQQQTTTNTAQTQSHLDQNVQVQRVAPTPHSVQDAIDFGEILNSHSVHSNSPASVPLETHPTAPPLPPLSAENTVELAAAALRETAEQLGELQLQREEEVNRDEQPAQLVEASASHPTTPIESDPTEQPQATSTPVTSSTAVSSTTTAVPPPDNVSPIVKAPPATQPKQRASSHEKTSRKTSTESTRSTASQREHRQQQRREKTTIGGKATTERGNLQGNESDSTTTGSLIARNGSERRSVHDRYKNIMQERAHILSRISGYRNDNPQANFRSSKTPVMNPLMQNLSNRSSVLGGKSSLPNNMSIDGSTVMDRTAYSAGIDPTLEHSVDLPKDQSGYGDDFVDAARRSRLNRNRPASRARSELGGSEPVYRMHGAGPNAASHRGQPFDHFMPQHFAHQFPGYYPQMMGRYSSMGNPYLDYRQSVVVDPRRPQSSYDPRAHERFIRAGGQLDAYDAFAQRDDEEELSDESESVSGEEEGSESEERGESEEELRKYNLMQQQAQLRYNQQRGAVPSFSMLNANASAPTGLPAPGGSLFLEPAVLYYLGSIHLDTARANSILYHSPPPAEYHRLLKPIEKAAYLFYAAVYKKLYNNVDDFHKKFNREFYKFICDGDTEDVALWKICKSMQDEYNSKRLAQSQRAYQASQSQLFSDERDSIDGDESYERNRPDSKRYRSYNDVMSDRASLYDRDDDRNSDAASIDQRAPLKFRTPHAFVTFGPGGRIVTVHPDISISTIQICDIKSRLMDPHTQRLIDAAQAFKGPLLAGVTPTHSVRLYIQRQMERIRQSEVAAENPLDNDVIDTLLVWQLLEMVVQQQGRVTGPDLARLLVAAGALQQAAQRNLPPAHAFHKEVPAPHHHSKEVSPPTSSAQSELRLPVVDPRAFDRFTQFLLGGHVDEAVESAMRDGLYADAMIVARRLFAGDQRRIAQIEERFLTLRPAANPVTTLLAVASDQPAPVLTNPPVDDTGSWRTHAAIVLANLATQTAMSTVYHLGRVLAKREYHAAADFCFLAVALLAGIDPFRPVENEEEEADVRKHIQLIHATLPDDDLDSTACRFGFSLSDLHATEIFDYAVKLAGGSVISPLSQSVEYQRRRIDYARLLADYGGFTTDAFKYCLDVARSIWPYYQQLSSAELFALCDLADQIRYSAAADPQDTAWIEMLRGMAAGLSQEGQTIVGQTQIQAAVGETAGMDEQHSVVESNQTMQSHEQPRSVERTHSLSAEAEDWHAQRQEPLHMGGGQGGYAAASAEDVTERRESVASSHGDIQREERRRHSESRNLMATSPSDSEYRSVPNSPPDHHQHHDNAHDNLMYYQTQYGESTNYDNSTEDTTESEQTSPGSSTVESSPERKPAPKLSQPIPSLPPQQQSYIPSVSLPTVPISTVSAAPKSRSLPSAQLPPQMPSATQQKPGTEREQPGALQNSSSASKGLFGMLKEQIVKKMPGPNPMRLPADTNPSIRWDPVKNRYVGEGVEEDAVKGPPPTMPAPAAPAANGPTPNSSTGGGLSSARLSGGARYFNPMQKRAASSSAASAQPSIEPPTFAPPSMAFFMPSMPVDSDNGTSADPFSAPSQDPLPTESHQTREQQQ